MNVYYYESVEGRRLGTFYAKDDGEARALVKTLTDNLLVLYKEIENGKMETLIKN